METVSQIPPAPDTALPPARRRNKGSIVVRSLSELEELREPWQGLTTEDAAPFQTFSWNLAWFRHFSDCWDEIAVYVSLDASVVFPLYRRGRSLRLAGDVTCDYQDAIARNAGAVGRALPELIRWAAGRNLDLDFRRLSSEGFLYEALRKLDASGAYHDSLGRPVGPCPYFEIPENAESYMARLPRKFRAELRRQLRRVSHEFPGTELVTRSAPEIDLQDVLSMVRFHSANFRCSGENPIDDPRLQSLLSEIKDQPEVGLRVSRYGNRDTDLAMDITFVRGTRFYGFLTAFNCEHARYSPGSCLLLSRLDRLAEQGIRIFDFLCGSESYKFRFASDAYEVHSVRLIRRSITGAWRFTGLRMERSLRALAKKVRDEIRAKLH